MRICYLSLISLLVIMVSHRAFAVQCHTGSVVRCLCAASMQLECDDGTSGWVKNDETPSSVTVTVVNGAGNAKSYVINNPPRGVRSYYKILVDHVVVVASDELLEVPQKFVQNKNQLRIGHEFYADIPFDDFMELERSDIPVANAREKVK